MSRPSPDHRNPARPIAVLLTVLVLAALTTACSSSGGGNGATSTTIGKPIVVASTDILGEVTRQILGNEATVVVLMPAGTNPRTFAPTPDQIATMSKAHIIVTIGLGLEQGLAPALTEARRNAVTVLEIGPQLGALPVDRAAGAAGGATASAASSATELDPRIWLDPDRMTHGARVIADLVTTRPGVDKTRIQSQTDAFAAALARADEDVQALMLPLPDDRRTLVSVAGPLGYIADRYGFVVVDQKHIEAQPITAIVTDQFAPADAARDVARRAGTGMKIITLDLDSFGRPGSGADTYPGLLVANARILAAAGT